MLLDSFLPPFLLLSPSLSHFHYILPPLALNFGFSSSLPPSLPQVLCAKEQPNPEDEEEHLEEVGEGGGKKGREGEGEGEVGLALIDQEERRSSSGRSPVVLA